MFEEEDLLPISALQHLLFCPRRAALVFIEGVWDENRFTAEGRSLHTRVHKAESESRRDVRIARGLRLRSLRLGLAGKADVVEFDRLSEDAASATDSRGLCCGTTLEGVPGLWRPFPVEYKRGRRRREEGYEIQLCAQGLCLEEMLDVEVSQGAIFYAETGRRMEVTFDERLRNETAQAAARLHELIASGQTPRAEFGKKCGKCSLATVCMPKATSARRSVDAYVQKAMTQTGWDET